VASQEGLGTMELVRGREHEPVNSKIFPHIGLNFSFVTDEEINVFVELGVCVYIYMRACTCLHTCIVNLSRHEEVLKEFSLRPTVG
jgi:hypothetical protein